ncbi:MAG: hypothetical protein V1792_16335 [Pseudomonadota bacterium]
MNHKTQGTNKTNGRSPQIAHIDTDDVKSVLILEIFGLPAFSFSCLGGFVATSQ